MKLAIRNNSNNNHEVLNKHKKSIIERLYKGTANKENSHTIIQSQDQIKTHLPVTMPNSKESYKYSEQEEVSVSQFMLPDGQKSNLNDSQSMLLSGYNSSSQLLKSKRSESENIVAKMENFSHHYYVKHREVKKDRKCRIERNLTRQLYELKNKKQCQEDLQKNNSMMETAFFAGISQQTNLNEEMCQLGLEGYYVKKVNKDFSKYSQQNDHRQSLKQFQPKIEIQRHSVARRIKTEIQLMQREQPYKKNAIYLHKQLKLAPKTQTERSLSSKGRQPGLIKRQNSQKDLLNWNKNSFHSLNHNKHESSQDKLRMIRQQLHQIYSITKMNSSVRSNIENKNLYYNLKKEKVPGPTNPQYKENMQDYYRQYLMQAKNHQNNFRTLVLHRE